MGGSKWGSCQGLYDAQRKKLLIQYAYFPSGNSDKPLNVKYYQVTSADHGKSWSSPVDITSVLAQCTESDTMVRGVAGSRIQTKTGRLLWAGYGRQGTTCTWYSDDGGETYHTHGLQSNGANANEVSIATADINTG